MVKNVICIKKLDITEYKYGEFFGIENGTLFNLHYDINNNKYYWIYYFNESNVKNMDRYDTIEEAVSAFGAGIFYVKNISGLRYLLEDFCKNSLNKTSKYYDFVTILDEKEEVHIDDIDMNKHEYIKIDLTNQKYSILLEENNGFIWVGLFNTELGIFYDSAKEAIAAAYDTGCNIYQLDSFEDFKNI